MAFLSNFFLAAEFVLAEAYNPLYGARPLKRYLEKHISTVLSRMIIAEQLVDNSIVEIDAINNQLTFATKKLPTRKRSPSPAYPQEKRGMN